MRCLLVAVLWLGCTADCTRGLRAQDYEFDIDAPEAVCLGSGAPFSAQYRLGVAPGRLAAGWTISAATSGPCAIVSATTAGTVAAPVDAVPPGLRDEDQFAFERTELTTGPDNEGVVSAVILGALGPITLSSDGSPHAVLNLFLEASAAGPCTILFRDGLEGSGEPVLNTVDDGRGFARPVDATNTAQVVVEVPRLVVEPDQLRFGAVAIGSRATLELAVRNPSLTCALQVSRLAVLAAPAQRFSYSGSAAFAVPPESTVIVEIAYTPREIRAESGTLRIESNAIASPLVDVPLSGSGVAPCQFGFAPAVAVPVRPFNFFVGRAAIRDLDGDGARDLAVSRAEGVVVLWNDGSGGFLQLTEISSEFGPALVVEDVNGDGALDIVAAHSLTDRISVMRKTGARAFAAPVLTPVGDRPESLAAGDLNADGRADLVTANRNSNNLSVLLNDGTGGFSETSIIAVGTAPASCAIADLDGDGDLDVAVSHLFQRFAAVLFNNGAGEFPVRVDLPLAPCNRGDGAFAVGAADFDGNQTNDLAVTCFDQLLVFLNPGDAGFGAAVPYASQNASSSVVVADLNRDGFLDLALPHELTNDVSVLLNDGSGAFTRAGVLPVGPAPRFLSAGDLNGDRVPDLVASGPNGASRSVFVLTNQSSACPQQGGGQVPGDCNADGRADVSDVVCMVRALASGTRSLSCGDGSLAHPANVALLDCSADGVIGFDDGVCLLSFLFDAGFEPPFAAGCVTIDTCPELCPP